jgi:hypothetical protein
MPTFASASCRHSRVRNHLASLLHRWAYRIEGRRAEHRAGEKVSLEALMRFRNPRMELMPEIAKLVHGIATDRAEG